MNQNLPIINLDNRWFIKQGINLQEIDKPNDFSGTNLILTDFNDAVFGLETITGPVEHSAALIEKRLRDVGLLDGPSKIIVHETRKIGDTASVLFTAIPAETYADYFESINKQNDHCLAIPLLAVLYKQSQLGKEKNYAYVFQHGRDFDLLIVNDRIIKKVSRLTAFSTSDEDMNATLETLSKEIDTFNTSMGSGLKSIHLAGFLTDNNELGFYSEKLHKLTDLDVITEKHSELIFNNKEYLSVIPSYLSGASSKDAANNQSSKVLYQSERLLPLVALVFVAILLSLSGLMWKWSNQINAIEKQLAQSNRAKLKEEIVLIKNDLQESNRQFASNKNAQSISQWLYDLNGIQSAPDPKHLIDDIGQALPEDVQIVGVSLDARRRPATVVLDGVIDKPLKFALKDLENLSAGLLNKGYKMLSNSSIELSDNNDFRMTLKVDYNDK